MKLAARSDFLFYADYSRMDGRHKDKMSYSYLFVWRGIMVIETNARGLGMPEKVQVEIGEGEDAPDELVRYGGPDLVRCHADGRCYRKGSDDVYRQV